MITKNFEAPYKSVELKYEREGEGNSQKHTYTFNFTDQPPIVQQKENKLILTIFGEFENKDFLHLVKNINLEEYKNE